jgi:hypothetical protein
MDFVALVADSPVPNVTSTRLQEDRTSKRPLSHRKIDTYEVNSWRSNILLRKARKARMLWSHNLSPTIIASPCTVSDEAKNQAIMTANHHFELFSLPYL